MNGRPGRADLFGCLLLGAVVAACYAPELVGRRAFFFFDVSSLNLPARDWAFRQIKSGHFPEWCTHWYAGFPFVAESQAGVYYPPNYFFFLLFPSWYATTLAYVGHVWLAGVGAYFLFRRWCSVRGAWVGAAAFALGGRMLEHQIHAAIAETIAWLPLILHGVLRFVEEGDRRGLWWSAGLAGVQALAGSLHTVVVSHLAIAVFLFAYSGLNRRALRRSALAYVVVGVSGMLLSACLLVPTLELFRQSHRSAGGVADWANFGALSPLRWVQFFLPGAFGSPAYSTAWLNDRDPVFETGLYHGGLIVVLAVVGAFAVADRRRRAAFAGLALVLVGLALAAGDMNLLGAGLRKLPIFGGIRVPARYLLLVGLGMCLLTSLGWEEMVEGAAGVRRRLWFSVAIVGAGSAAALTWMYGGLLGELPPHIDAPRFQEFMTRLLQGSLSADVPRLAATLLAVGLCLFGMQRPTTRLVVLACLTFDLGWTVRFKYPTIGPEFHSEPASVEAAKLLCAPDPPRVAVLWSLNQSRKVDLNADGWRLSMDPYRRIGECLYYERGPLFDIGLFPDVGQLPLQPRRLAEFRSVTPDYLQTARLLGVALVMSPTAMIEEQVVYRGVGCVLERVSDPAPYAFFSNVVEHRPEPEVLSRIFSAEFQPTRNVVLEGEGSPITAPARTERALARWRGPNQLTLDVNAPGDGVVLVHEMFDAGWKATVDRAPARIERANWLFMAVPVGAGQRHIELTYAPTSVRVGRWISAFALLLWLAIRIRGLGQGTGVVVEQRPPNPWIFIGVFLAIFAASALLLHAHWVDAVPTALDQR